MEVLFCECVNDLHHSVFHLLNCLLTTASEFRELPKVTGSKELSWCPSWSNSLWQGWNWGLVHCPGKKATDPISGVLASSQGISSWTPLKPQHSNPNPLTYLLLQHLSSSLTDSLPSLNLLCHSKTDARFMQDGRKAVWSIPYVSVAFFLSFKQSFIAYRSSKVSSRPDLHFWNSPAVKIRL